MDASSPLNRFHEHRLEIRDLAKLSEIIDHLRSNQSQESQITVINISNNAVEATESEEYNPSGRIRESGPEVFDHISMQMASIINEIHQRGGLESFRWVCNTSEKKLKRGTVFWEALWETATTLKGLDIGFFEHELNHIGVDVVSSPFVCLTCRY